MDYQGRVANLVTVENRSFGPGDEVVIDGHAYVNCVFAGCKIIYSGGDFGMRNTTKTDSCDYEFRDAAARSGNFFYWFKIDPQRFGPPIPYDSPQ